MLTRTKKCKECGIDTLITLGDPVPGKEDKYYFNCPKGHIIEIFVGKNLLESLKKSD